MKRERVEKRNNESVCKRSSVDASTNDFQWHEVWLELHNKPAMQESPFASFRYGWKEHMKEWYRINKSDDRRELPIIPQPTHTIESLARTNFKHRPFRRNISQPRKRHSQSLLGTCLYVF
ncbi:uncharacterized protein LOC144625749 [Crassostrea virginica]